MTAGGQTRPPASVTVAGPARRGEASGLVRDGRRVAIEDVQPAVDGGRFPAKRIVGDVVTVEADVLCDSHDVLAGQVLHRHIGPDGMQDGAGAGDGRRRAGKGRETDGVTEAAGTGETDVTSEAEEKAWTASPLSPIDNDRWRGEFTVTHVGWHLFTVEAWPDRLRSWQHDHRSRLAAGQDVRADLLVGAELAEQAASRAAAEAGARGRSAGGRSDGVGPDAQALHAWAARMRDAAQSGGKAHPRTARRAPVALGGSQTASSPGLDPGMLELADKYPDRSRAVRHAPLRLWVDGERARSSAWYEMFPRSASPDPGRPGTLRDVVAHLPYVAGMGFDVLYLPPVHPIGRSHRKGPNNTSPAGSRDPGSPWAIGAAEGGHTAIHPELGTLDDYRRLVQEAKRHGIDVAFDLALQCSPDHPWVREHPEWFRRRPDGSIPSAENPPKKYEDIVALDFECEDWRGLWEAVLEVVLFWVDQGVRTFRVDNPHTKPFTFWTWLIAEVRGRHPDVLFLAEAFTRPKVMARLAKVGFSHSYTYFAWRNSKPELEGYLREITSPPLCEFLRPHLWPNTPDILTDLLQRGGRTASALRLVLASTLCANYGVYGPVFELAETRPLSPGREDYLDSEKYQVQHWDLDRPGNLHDLVTRVNRLRRDLAPLRRDDGLHFHGVDNDRLVAYSRHAKGVDPVLVVVNLDPMWTQRGWTQLDLGRLGLGPEEDFDVVDVLNGPTYTWRGPSNYVELDPQRTPAHVFALRRRRAGGSAAPGGGRRA